MNRAVLMFACLGLGLGACEGAGYPDDATADSADMEGKADGVERPVGTFAAGMAPVGQFRLVVLTTDKRFHRERAASCTGGPCSPDVEEGTYTWSKSGSTRYVRFVDPDGVLMDRYAYTLSDGGRTLKLRVPGTNDRQTLAREDSAAWCGQPEDCDLQELAQPRCPGQWSCDEGSTCAYRCTSLCELSGGACVGVAPGACAGGIIGDAEWFSCGDQVGVQCCLPQQGYRAAGESCGGHVGYVCAGGLYCAYAEGLCGKGDTMGTCTETPRSCRQHHEPVCGCDGETYSNSCLAAVASTSVAHSGACQ
ncbi:MAG: hypothetical protein MUC69_00920 [Gemmatimonadales bacterium]|jgi:hypothetical protein|nr:hypothetical protein [Gemmatimonadales bacterium]